MARAKPSKIMWHEYRRLRRAMRKGGVNIPTLRTLVRRGKARRISRGTYEISD